MKSLNDSLEEYKKVNYNKSSLQSYERYIERLKTFEISKWFAKSVKFSPSECAKHGWYNLTTETLKCVSCSNILYFSERSLANLNKTSNKTSNWSDPKRLVEEHNPNCPWRTLSVPDQFIQIDASDEELVFKSFVERFKTYQKSSSAKLPVIDRDILQCFEAVGDLSESINKCKVILSCSGWTFIENKEMLKCDRCLRSIGLWLYNKESNESENVKTHSFKSTANSSGESGTKRKLTDELTSNELATTNSESLGSNKAISKLNKELNPIREHFNWCPWLTQLNESIPVIDSNTNKSKRVNKNPCFVFYELVCKRLQAKPPSHQVVARKSTSSLAVAADGADRKSEAQSPLSTSSLIDRAKSAHSVLINCASSLYNNLN